MDVMRWYEIDCDEWIDKWKQNIMAAKCQRRRDHRVELKGGRKGQKWDRIDLDNTVYMANEERNPLYGG